MTTNEGKVKIMRRPLITVMVFVVILVIAVVLISILSYHFKKSDKDNTLNPATFRLPFKQMPLHYNVTIKTYLPFYVPFPSNKNLTFDGQVAITIQILEPLWEINLYVKNITVDPLKCSVVTNGSALKIEQVLNHEKVLRLELVGFLMSRKLEKYEVITLTVTYTGLISNTLGGLYQAIYKQTDGVIKIAAVTQFEPINARRMVPCFDEPRYKANWTVTVIHPKGTRAISNGIEN
ncbi:hypothetical protein KIN20_019481 [Parelaphostrongylus tenuis]|uniref:Aminopeptidase N-like N-terminal domain-containing protein n=1 Tax=Parelaphostrongylus tenuis TaxID=148309 RepID=A0AAD5QV37_PARTN|nr:hypothetical protein KIN20_019481 [Parelaphostrongylus tenuis]